MKKNFFQYISENLRQNGFTVVELLISLAVFGVIGTVIISVLFTTLRLGKKSDLLVSLKYSGNSAASQVAKTIRFAKSITSPSSCVTPVASSSITVTSLADNSSVILACTSGSPATITLGGESLIDTSSTTVSNCSFTCSQPTLNDPPTITLRFALSSINSSNFAETSASIPFQTSVTLRNYSQ